MPAEAGHWDGVTTAAAGLPSTIPLKMKAEVGDVSFRLGGTFLDRGQSPFLLVAQLKLNWPVRGPTKQLCRVADFCWVVVHQIVIRVAATLAGATPAWSQTRCLRDRLE